MVLAMGGEPHTGGFGDGSDPLRGAARRGVAGERPGMACACGVLHAGRCARGAARRGLMMSRGGEAAGWWRFRTSHKCTTVGLGRFGDWLGFAVTYVCSNGQLVFF